METTRDNKFKFDWQRKILACRLGSSTTAVALALSVHANKDGTNSHPGERRLAHECEMSVRTVRRSLEHLRDLGLLRRTHRGSVSEKRAWADRYDLTLPEDLANRVDVVAEPPSGSKAQGRGGMANHWADLETVADDFDLDRSKVINDLIHWYLRRPGAKLPERPSRERMLGITGKREGGT